MMKKLLQFSLCVALCGQAFAIDPIFIPKDNDTWVMAGDSITAQRLHSSYIEAFYRTRYPQLHLHFRNSGISGDTVSKVLARFDYDVAAWKPTIVSVELGMNDVQVSENGAAKYVDGMKKLADQIRILNAKPIFISASPVNDGSFMNAWTSAQCKKIDPFTEALKALGQKENVPVIDQYHPLIDLWAPNKILEDAGAFASRIRALKPENNASEFQTLQAFAKTWEGKPNGIPLGGNPIHPGPVGQYTMAATILAGLNVDREVSFATIKPDGTVVSTKYCKITNVVRDGDKLSFVRLDERSPWPIFPADAAALNLMPEIADLSRYILTIPGLPAGQYRITMNEKPAATVSNEELEKGWNMSTVVDGALGDRATLILELIKDLQGPLNNTWRAASKEKNPEKLAAAQKALDECEAKVQAACQPAQILCTVELVR